MQKYKYREDRFRHTEVAKKFYNSTPWRKTRRAFINLKGEQCVHCERKGVFKKGKIVDHIVELNLDNISNIDIALGFDNLQYLCLECHNTKTFRQYDDSVEKGLAFDSEGNLIELQEGN